MVSRGTALGRRYPPRKPPPTRADRLYERLAGYRDSLERLEHFYNGGTRKLPHKVVLELGHDEASIARAQATMAWLQAKILELEHLLAGLKPTSRRLIAFPEDSR